MKPVLTSLLMGIVSVAAGSVTASSITFYQNDNFGGRQFVADRPVENPSRTGFNDRIHSAVVHDGRWEICVDADFNGSCSILVPGDYPGDYAALPGMNNAIASGRSIANYYPYSAKPEWRRDSFR